MSHSRAGVGRAQAPGPPDGGASDSLAAGRASPLHHGPSLSLPAVRLHHASHHALCHALHAPFITPSATPLHHAPSSRPPPRPPRPFITPSATPLHHAPSSSPPPRPTPLHHAPSTRPFNTPLRHAPSSRPFITPSTAPLHHALAGAGRQMRTSVAPSGAAAPGRRGGLRS